VSGKAKQREEEARCDGVPDEERLAPDGKGTITYTESKLFLAVQGMTFSD